MPPEEGGIGFIWSKVGDRMPLEEKEDRTPLKGDEAEYWIGGSGPRCSISRWMYFPGRRFAHVEGYTLRRIGPALSRPGY